MQLPLFKKSYLTAANCGDKIEASAVQKRISTPHYPTHKYENNMDCMWILEALPGQEISLNISKGETEKVVDYIQVNLFSISFRCLRMINT